MTGPDVRSSSRRAVLASACAACAAALAGCARYGTSNGLAGSPAQGGGYPYPSAAGTEPSSAASGPVVLAKTCLLYTSPSPRDPKTSRMPSSA